MEHRELSRRDFLRLGGLAGTGAILAACAPKIVEKEVTRVAKETVVVEKKVEPPKKEDVKIQIMFWGGTNRRAAVTNACEQFVKEYPGIEVELLPTGYGDLHDKLLTMAAGGAAPDLSALDNYHLAAYASKGALTDLTPYANAEGPDLLDGFFDAALLEGMWNGKRWALPYIGSSRVCYFNVDLLEAKGLERPDELWEAGKWTWNKYLETALAMTDTSKGPAEAVYGTEAQTSLSGPLPSWVWCAKGALLNEDRTKCLLNEEGAVEALKFQQDLLFKHKVAPTAEAKKDIDLVATGKIAVWPGWRGGCMRYRDYDYTFEVTHLPVGKEKVALYKGNSMVMPSGGKHLSEAWELCKYVTGHNAVEYFVTGGDATPRKDSKDALMRSTPPTNNQVFYNALDEGWARLLPFTPKWLEWVDATKPFMDRIYLDGEDVKAVMDECVVAVNKILAE